MNLIEKIKTLDEENKKIFERIFNFREIEISLKNNLKETKFPDFLKQKLMIIEDKVLFRQTIYNLSRQKRKQPESKTSKEEESTQEYDPFCNYQNETPIDEIGRLENDFSVTASNLAKMADYHSLIIFKKHKFFHLEEEDFLAAINLAKEWFEKIKNYDPKIKTEILIWNYHYRSGASILHPHFQILAFLDIPAKIKFLKQRMDFYESTYRQNYFQNYFSLMEALNLAKKFYFNQILNEENAFKVYLNLTPLKEKEINFYGNLTKESTLIIWQILKKLTEIGISSFNFLYIYDSPLLKNIGFFIDRGDNKKLNSDFGSLEVFLTPVVSYDPIILAQEIFSE